MLSRSRILVFLVVLLAIAVNSWSRMVMRNGGVHHWHEQRQIGWPCAILGYGVEYWADYGNPMFSQPTVYHWKVSPPRELILYGSLWLYNGIHFGGLFLTLVWWSTLGGLLWSISHRERWQFTIRQLLLLPLLVASAFALPLVFR